MIQQYNPPQNIKLDHWNQYIECVNEYLEDAIPDEGKKKKIVESLINCSLISLHSWHTIQKPQNNYLGSTLSVKRFIHCLKFIYADMEVSPNKIFLTDIFNIIYKYYILKFINLNNEDLSKRRGYKKLLKDIELIKQNSNLAISANQELINNILKLGEKNNDFLDGAFHTLILYIYASGNLLPPQQKLFGLVEVEE